MCGRCELENKKQKIVKASEYEHVVITRAWHDGSRAHCPQNRIRVFGTVPTGEQLQQGAFHKKNDISV